MAKCGKMRSPKSLTASTATKKSFEQRRIAFCVGRVGGGGVGNRSGGAAGSRVAWGCNVREDEALNKVPGHEVTEVVDCLQRIGKWLGGAENDVVLCVGRWGWGWGEGMGWSGGQRLTLEIGVQLAA